MRPVPAGYTRDLASALATDDAESALRPPLRRVGMSAEAIEGMSRSPFWPVSLAIAPTLAYDDAAMGYSAIPVELCVACGCRSSASRRGQPGLLQYGARVVAEAATGRAFEADHRETHDIQADAVAPDLRSFLVPDRPSESGADAKLS